METYGVRVTDRYYERIPERVLNVNVATIVWDVPVITDSTIFADKPNRVLHDKIKKNCLLNETAMPNDSNINTKETEKLSKYKDLEIAVKRMSKVRTKVVPVITGALGTIKKALDLYLQTLPGHPSAIGLQKITLMSSENINRKVLG